MSETRPVSIGPDHVAARYGDLGGLFTMRDENTARDLVGNDGTRYLPLPMRQPNVVDWQVAEAVEVKCRAGGIAGLLGKRALHQEINDVRDDGPTGILGSYIGVSEDDIGRLPDPQLRYALRLQAAARAYHHGAVDLVKVRATHDGHFLDATYRDDAFLDEILSGVSSPL